LQLLFDKANPVLLTLFADVYAVLKTEIAHLSPARRAGLPQSSTLIELLKYHCSSKRRSTALDSAFVCLYQIASFLRSVSDIVRPWLRDRLTKSSHSGGESLHYHNGQRTLNVGICVGLLAASAISCSHDLSDLASITPEIVAIAFRLGLVAQEMLDRNQVDTDSTTSCSVVIANVDQDTAAELIQTYCEVKGIPAFSSPYISAIGHDNVTISGPPSSLRDFLVDHPALRHISVLVNGLFHAPHLYRTSHIDYILSSGSSLLKNRSQQAPLFSNDSGAQVNGQRLDELLAIVLSDILLKPLRWHAVLESIAVEAAAHNGSSWTVRPFACGSVRGITTAITSSCNNNVEVCNQSSKGKLQGDIRSTARSSKEKIAIIGFSGRFPEADDDAAFWQLLMDGLDVHKEIPKERFDPWKYYDPTGKKKNTSAVTKGAFIKSPGDFDPRFFGLSPREAEQADPAQRLALMTAYEAIEMAGLVPDATPSTQRNRVGVFYGTTSDDWREVNSGQNVDTYFIPGKRATYIS
jgi:naphtho-gamma-pyrone polyketide synthase